MPIAVSCLCGRALRIKEELAGRKIRCPACQPVLAVPAPLEYPDPEDLALEVLRGDEPEDSPPAREGRRSAIQSEPPEALPAGRRPLREEGISIGRRKSLDAPPVKSRPRVRREEPRSRPRVAFEEGWFASTNAGVIGGVLMILIAVVWLVVGLAAGRLFFYPVFLAIVGIIAIGKGLFGGGD